MAHDLFLGRTSHDWSRSDGPPAPPLALSFSPAENRSLKLLEPSTAAFAVNVIGWARSRGIPASLSTQSVIYTPEDSARYYAEKKSRIAPGRLDWHNVGRAFHIRGPSGFLKYSDYATIAQYVRSQGGDWLGDTPLRDLAHYEYHPGIDIASYRKTALSTVEFKKAQARARRYG
jgi:hypothetical protein